MSGLFWGNATQFKTTLDRRRNRVARFARGARTFSHRDRHQARADQKCSTHAQGRPSPGRQNDRTTGALGPPDNLLGIKTRGDHAASPLSFGHDFQPSSVVFFSHPGHKSYPPSTSAAASAGGANAKFHKSALLPAAPGRRFRPASAAKRFEQYPASGPLSVPTSTPGIRRRSWGCHIMSICRARTPALARPCRGEYGTRPGSP